MLPHEMKMMPRFIKDLFLSTWGQQNTKLAYWIICYLLFCYERVIGKLNIQEMQSNIHPSIHLLLLIQGLVTVAAG